MNSDKL